MAHSRRRIVVGLHVQRLHKSHKSLTGEFSWLLRCCYCLKQNSKKHFLFRRGSDKLVIYLQAASIYIWLCILFEIRLFAICDVALPIKWSALCLVASALIQKCCWCCNQFDGIFNLIGIFILEFVLLALVLSDWVEKIVTFCTVQKDDIY